MRNIAKSPTAKQSVEAMSIDLRQTATYTVGRKACKVARVKTTQERRADEIGARPPYAYTSACLDERWRR